MEHLCTSPRSPRCSPSTSFPLSLFSLQGNEGFLGTAPPPAPARGVPSLHTVCPCRGVAKEDEEQGRSSACPRAGSSWQPPGQVAGLLPWAPFSTSSLCCFSSSLGWAAHFCPTRQCPFSKTKKLQSTYEHMVTYILGCLCGQFSVCYHMVPRI